MLTLRAGVASYVYFYIGKRFPLGEKYRYICMLEVGKRERLTVHDVGGNSDWSSDLDGL